MSEDQSQPFPLLRPLLYAAGLVTAGLLLPFVWLRETPHFWTDVGGYPVWLRDLLLVAYHPCFSATWHCWVA